MTSTRENEVSEQVTIEQLRGLRDATDTAMSRLTQDGANIGDGYVAQGAQMEFKRHCETYVRQLLASPTPPAAGGEMGATFSTEWTGPKPCVSAAAPQQSAQGGWLPIESAPRDGTAVLLVFKEELPEWAKQFDGGAFVGRNNDDLSAWRYAGSVGCAGIPDEWLAGWLPLPVALPAPPKTAGGSP